MARTEQLRKQFETQPYTPVEHGSVLNEQEFLTDFGHEARSASEILTAVMLLEASSKATQVLDIFRNEPQDAERTLIYDAMSEHIHDGVILAPYAYLPGTRDDVQAHRNAFGELVDSFKEGGTNVRVLNEPKSLTD